MSELTTCPFNPAHTIDKRKLLNHIEKCKKVSKLFIVDQNSIFHQLVYI